MPVEQVTVTQIVCDNPACPGNSLDPSTQAGWMFVTASVDGTGVQQVYCSPECAGTITAALAEAAV